MAKFLFTGSYTAEGARGVLAEGGSSRRDVVDKLVGSLGGSVEAFYFGFGGDDFYVIADLPDHAAAAAGSMTVSATGASAIRTVVLMTPEEIDAAMKLSPTYSPPGS